MSCGEESGSKQTRRIDKDELILIWKNKKRVFWGGAGIFQ